MPHGIVLCRTMPYGDVLCFFLNVFCDLLCVAEYLRLDKNKAGAILSEVKHAVSNWEKAAKQIGIARTEIELMRSAFRY